MGAFKEISFGLVFVADDDTNYRGVFLPTVTAVMAVDGGRNHLQQKTYFSRSNNNNNKIIDICMGKCVWQSLVCRQKQFFGKIQQQQYCHVRNEWKCVSSLTMN